MWDCSFNHDDDDTDDRDFDHDFQDLGHGLNDDNDYEEVSCTYWAKLFSLLARWLFGNRQALISRSKFCDNHQRATSREKRRNRDVGGGVLVDDDLKRKNTQPNVWNNYHRSSVGGYQEK